MKNAYELAYKKLVHFKAKKAYKKFEKNKFEWKTNEILLLDITTWYWGQFCHLIWSVYVNSKFHIFTVGAQSINRVCQNLEKLLKEYLLPQKTQKAAVFLFERTWAEND